MAYSFGASAMDQMMLQMMRQMRQGNDESASNLPRLQAVFAGNPQVSISQDGRCLQVTFSISSAAENLVRSLLNAKFLEGNNNTLRLYMSIVRPFDAPHCLETLLFAESGGTKDCIYVDEWDYSDVCRFSNIEQVIDEVRRVVALIC